MDKENGLLWTRLILETYTRLPQFARSFERASSALVKSSLITGKYGSGHTTEELFEKMIELNYRKTGIVNLKVLTDQALRRIEPSLANVLQARFFLKLDFETIAQKENIARRTIFRRVEKGIEKFYDALVSLGFNAKRLDREYADEPLIMQEKRRVANKMREESESYSKSS